MFTKVEEGNRNSANVDGVFELVMLVIYLCYNCEFVPLTHPRKVRSAAKYTLGSTRTGT